MNEPYPAGTGNSRAPDNEARKSETSASAAPTNHGAGNHMHGETAGLFPLAPLANGFASALEINGPALSAMMALRRKLHDEASSSANAWVGFLGRRVNDNIAMAQRLASCRSPEDIYHVNVAYLQKAAHEYLAQVERSVVNAHGSTMALFASLAGNSAARSEDSRPGH